MRSSDLRQRARQLLAVGLLAGAALVIGKTRPALAERYHGLRVTGDVYALPAPEQVVAGSLGYRAALADFLYAHVLVSYGLHFQEKRRFEFVGEYLDTINALDPAFREPYRFADTLLVLAPEPPRQRDYLKAKEILERGLKNRPFDSELWLVAGQYMAYLGGPHLEDPALQRQWRRRAAEVLSRACELASKNENIPYHCIVAADLFDKVGARDAAIRSLRRILAVTDDPEVERMALAYLEARLSERERDRAERRKKEFSKAWRDDLPFVSKDALLILGPRVDTARCAGPGRALSPPCYTDWAGWAEGHAASAAAP